MDDVIGHYKEMLSKLLSKPRLRFDKNLSQELPNTAGVYRVLETDAHTEETIYVGKTVNLRTRIFRNHLNGKSERSILRKKLIRSGLCEDEKSVTQYLTERCSVQISEIEDERGRSWFEHFTIAVLKPRYND